MKSIFSRYFIILVAGAFVLGLAACQQAEEPAEVEVEEVEVEEAAPADTDMAEPTMEDTVQDTGDGEVEVEETVEETVDSIEDTASPAPEGATDDTGGEAQ